MLQSQKRFEYNADFWDMRWGMKELAEGDTVMASFPHLSKVFVRVFCSEKNGTKVVTKLLAGHEKHSQSRSITTARDAGSQEPSRESTRATALMMLITCTVATTARCPRTWSDPKTSQQSG